ncbi:hypothetical protein V5O48_013834 [Marasmius crinis-equi]|uniref:Uncharacterized protein n=1 Tax=Marasmius crinis-equi TaxID=585013 RepID=A0ABR3EZD5_9AGAR
MLPVLLEFALLFFFAGILDLFWSLKVEPLFVVGCISIGMSGFLYCVTTIIPGIATMGMIRRQALKVFPTYPKSRTEVYRPTWPYKSPQAWGLFKFFTSIISISPWVIFANSAHYSTGINLLDLTNTMTIFLNRFTNWSQGDLFFVNPWWLDENKIDVNLWEGIKSITAIFRDTIFIQPYLVTILKSYSPSIALPLALPRYHRVYTWIDSEDFRIDSPAVKARNAKINETLDRLAIPSWTTDTEPSLERDSALQLQIIKNNWMLETKRAGSDEFIAETQRISKENVPKRTKVNFTPFFCMAKQLWEDNRGVELLDIYRDEWMAYSGSIANEKIAIDGDERYQLMASFARYIKRHLDLTREQEEEEVREGEEGLTSSSDPQPILTSDKGLEFLHFIHNQVIEHKLYDMERYANIATFPVGFTWDIIDDWEDAMKVVQRMKGLPGNYFAKFPSDESGRQHSEETVGRSGVLGRIGASVRNALARTRARNIPDSHA